MKKLVFLLAAAVLVISSLTGCAAPKVYKLGTASFTEVSSRAATAEVAGRVQFTTIYTTVLLDKDNKIVWVSIDSAQNNGTFDTLGAIVKAEAAPTKKEKGDAYGMKAASAIGKEWFEQIAALEEYFVGKTVAEIMAMPLTEEAPDDLKTSVTIGITGYQEAVKKAADNAVEVKGVKSVGSASVTTVAGRTATAEVAGRVQTNVVFTGVAFDKDGKVLAVAIDNAQNSGTFDTMGAIVKAEVSKTKIEKGDEYGMKAASAIGKEWYEQMEALTAAMVGKTVAEILAIPTAKKDDAHPEVPTGDDLKTSVSISIEGYRAAVEKAFEAKVEIK